MGRTRQITRSAEAKHEGEFVEAVELQAETEKAIGLPTRDGDPEPIWLPKSQIDAMEGEDGRVFCYIPTWLARKKEVEKVRKY
jgi:hypothetical protein